MNDAMEVSIITCMICTCMFAAALTMGGPIGRQASQSEITVPIGGTVAILCPFAYHDLWKWVYWKKNDHKIYSLEVKSNTPTTTDPRYEGSNHATGLTIKDLKKTDSGFYHCEVVIIATTDFIEEGDQVLLSVTDQEVGLSTTSPGVSFRASTTIPPQPAEDHKSFLGFIITVLIINIIFVITVFLGLKYRERIQSLLAGFGTAFRRREGTCSNLPNGHRGDDIDEGDAPAEASHSLEATRTYLPYTATHGRDDVDDRLEESSNATQSLEGTCSNLPNRHRGDDIDEGDAPAEASHSLMLAEKRHAKEEYSRKPGSLQAEPTGQEPMKAVMKSSASCMGTVLVEAREPRGITDMELYELADSLNASNIPDLVLYLRFGMAAITCYQHEAAMGSPREGTTRLLMDWRSNKPENDQREFIANVLDQIGCVRLGEEIRKYSGSTRHHDTVEESLQQQQQLSHATSFGDLSYVKGEEKKKYEEMRTASLNLIAELREAESQGIPPGRIQCALYIMEELGDDLTDPIAWIAANWSDVVQDLANKATQELRENFEMDVDTKIMELVQLSEESAEKYLEECSGNTQEAIKECTQRIQEKILEIQELGSYSVDDIVAILKQDDVRGDPEKALDALQLKIMDDDNEFTYFHRAIKKDLLDMLTFEVYEQFYRKPPEWNLMHDEHFCWCAHGCSSSFINRAPDRRKMRCPECNKLTCFHCKKQWMDEHEGISCEAFQQWKENNDPDLQAQGLAAHLNENGIECPRCKMRYELAKGGCMHFKCPRCTFEFCCGCSQPIKRGDVHACNKFGSCLRKGLHAHHPRDGLFYPRDKNIDFLQKHLDENLWKCRELRRSGYDPLADEVTLPPVRHFVLPYFSPSVTNLISVR